MIDKSRLEIKSHSDELLKEVSEYLKKYPRIINTDPDLSTVELLTKLNEEVKFLERVLKNNEENKAKR